MMLPGLMSRWTTPCSRRWFMPATADRGAALAPLGQAGIWG